MTPYEQWLNMIGAVNADADADADADVSDGATVADAAMQGMRTLMEEFYPTKVTRLERLVCAILQSGYLLRAECVPPRTIIDFAKSLENSLTSAELVSSLDDEKDAQFVAESEAMEGRAVHPRVPSRCTLESFASVRRKNRDYPDDYRSAFFNFTNKKWYVFEVNHPMETYEPSSFDAHWVIVS